LLVSVVGEAVSWRLLYRTSRYQTNVANVERLYARIERMRAAAEQMPVAAAVRERKKIDALEVTLRGSHRELLTSKLRTQLLVSLLFMGSLWFWSSRWSGVVAARLPFEPIFFIRPLSRRGLDGDDLHDASFVFIYVLASM